MQEHTLIVVVSIATAGLTMALGAIGAAIGESRIASAAMDALCGSRTNLRRSLARSS